jgi:hypothetical protein
VPKEASTLRGGIVRRVDALLNVTARFSERLAHLTRHEIGDLVLSLRHQVADAPKHIAAGGSRRLAPLLETRRRLDHALDVRSADRGKATDHVETSAGFWFSKPHTDQRTQSPPMKF